MTATDNYRTTFFRQNISKGAAIGILVGSVVGLVAGGTVFVLFGNSLVYSIVVVAAFIILFAIYGGFMGFLFDVDARERIAAQPEMIPSLSKSARRKRTKTQPLAVTGSR